MRKELLTSAVQRMYNKYAELLQKIDEADEITADFIEYDILVEIDMKAEALLEDMIDEDVNCHYEYSLVENLCRTLRSTLYATAIEKEREC